MIAFSQSRSDCRASTVGPSNAKTSVLPFVVYHEYITRDRWTSLHRQVLGQTFAPPKAQLIIRKGSTLPNRCLAERFQYSDQSVHCRFKAQEPGQTSRNGQEESDVKYQRLRSGIQWKWKYHLPEVALQQSPNSWKRTWVMTDAAISLDALF